MALITVKEKFQIVIPKRIRDEIGLHVGDVLEAKVERKKITFSPKSVIDRGIEESLRDFREGRSYGPFTHKESMAFLHAAVREARKRRSK